MLRSGKRIRPESDENAFRVLHHLPKEVRRHLWECLKRRHPTVRPPQGWKSIALIMFCERVGIESTVELAKQLDEFNGEICFQWTIPSNVPNPLAAPDDRSGWNLYDLLVGDHRTHWERVRAKICRSVRRHYSYHRCETYIQNNRYDHHHDPWWPPDRYRCYEQHDNLQYDYKHVGFCAFPCNSARTGDYHMLYDAAGKQQITREEQAWFEELKGVVMPVFLAHSIWLSYGPIGVVLSFLRPRPLVS